MIYLGVLYYCYIGRLSAKMAVFTGSSAHQEAEAISLLWNLGCLEAALANRMWWTWCSGSSNTRPWEIIWSFCFCSPDSLSHMFRITLPEPGVQPDPSQSRQKHMSEVPAELQLNTAAWVTPADTIRNRRTTQMNIANPQNLTHDENYCFQPYILGWVCYTKIDNWKN